MCFERKTATRLAADAEAATQHLHSLVHAAHAGPAAGGARLHAAPVVRDVEHHLVGAGHGTTLQRYVDAACGGVALTVRQRFLDQPVYREVERFAEAVELALEREREARA